MRDQLHLSATTLAKLRHPEASSEALDLLHWAVHAVLYRGTIMAIEMASKVGPFVCHRVVCYFPGGRWGNTERVVTQWRHPVASWVPLDMLHWVMPSDCSSALPWPSKWPTTEVDLFVIIDFVIDHNHS
jgi:hypothetical protein